MTRSTLHAQHAPNQADEPVARSAVSSVQRAPIHASVPSLEGVWASEIVPWARSMRATRDRLMRKIFLRAVATVSYFAALLLGVRFAEVNVFLGILGAWAGVAVLVWALWPLSEKDQQDREAKRRVMGALCAAANLDYDIEAKSFSAADFDTFTFHTKIGSPKYQLEDYIAGTYAGLGFQLCEAKLIGRSHGKTFCAFHGLLLRIPMSKSFAGQTFVQPARERGLDKIDLGAARLLTRARWPETVRLEDPRFGQQFRVYASDQIEARYLLTPAMMVRLIALADRAGDRRVECAFLNGELLLALGVTHDMFEVTKLLDDPESFAPVWQLQEELSLIYNLIDCLTPSNKIRA
jgi:hypothetical protein